MRKDPKEPPDDPFVVLIAVVLTFVTSAPTRSEEAASSEPDMLSLSRDALIGGPEAQAAALEFFVARGGRDMIPSLVLILRIGGDHVWVAEALSTLTGEEIRTWREGMVWQEAHPEIAPHSSYYDLKFWYWSGVDPAFRQFFNNPPDRAAMRIRFEEITWGGVKVDGIPALDNPAMIAATEAEYLLDEDLVFGVEINGDARAYPLRILGWHEMANDVVGGVPVALAYCTLCGAGILFETQLDGRDTPFVFGSSGLLYRSNKLMFDRETLSLWNQFTGEPVSGPLAQSGIALNIRPMVITSWAAWRTAHPDTLALALDTGFIRDYGSGVVYRDYFASPDLMFPTRTDETHLSQKAHVFGVRVAGGAKAWPLDAFADRPVINDQVGFSPIVLIGDAETRTVRAYERGERTFAAGPPGALTDGDGAIWRISESALLGPSGEQLARMPGHVAYWFAWDGYLASKVRSTVASERNRRRYGGGASSRSSHVAAKSTSARMDISRASVSPTGPTRTAPVASKAAPIFGNSLSSSSSTSHTVSHTT